MNVNGTYNFNIQLCDGYTTVRYVGDAMTAKHPGAKDLMAEGFRDSYVWRRCPHIQLAITRYQSLFYRNLPKGLGSWQLKSQKREKLVSELCKGVMGEWETRGPIWNCGWQDRSGVWRKSLIWTNHHFANVAFWSAKYWFLAWCTLWSQLLPLRFSGNEATFRSDAKTDRSMLGLLHYSC